MSHTQEEPAADPLPGLSERPLTLLLGVAALGLLASLSAVVWPALRSLIPWLLPVVAGAVLGIVWFTRRRPGGERPSPAQAWARRAQRLEALLDDAWLLRTDAQGRLRHIKAPAGGGDAASLPAAGAVMAQAWECEDPGATPAWRALWAQGVVVPLTRVRRSGAPDSRLWDLRAQPILDNEARLLGHESRLSEAAATLASPERDSEADPFVYSVSHDLRAPLRIIQGFARIVREDYAGVLDHAGLDQLGRIENAAQRMDAMIESLLSLSRLSSRPLDRRPVNLSEIAHTLLEDLRRTAPERQVDLLIAEDMVCEGDPTLLRLVLENLLGNAWKYSAKRERARIEIGVTTDTEHGVRYHVRDNGAGFDMRYADKLFAPFQRLHSASEFEGTGVGLASARRIVQRHGGRLWGEGSVDQGACFYFTLR